ncbi:MAG TPA: LysR family transcriptional regulator [Candidatus Anaerotignum merdipullorum]|nr:LysR family transcriptional regulator [Candidatus Anaerotignum merdipullorum]
MTLSQLEYIMEIYHYGSMNKASQHLFVSQSAISTAIRELEEEMGITIFSRSNRGITLTEEGQEFLTKIRPIWEQCKEVHRFYTKKEFDQNNSLSISTQRYPFCTKAFVEFLQKQDMAHFRFGFKECPMGKVLDEVQSGKSDLGIIFLSEMTEAALYRQFSSKKLEFHELKRIRPHVFLSKTHPLAQKTEIPQEDLLAYPYVVFTKKDEISLNFSEEANLQQNLDFPQIIYINDRATFYNIVAHTNALSTGSGVLPEGYCDQRVCAIPLSDPAEDMCIGWIKKKEAPLSLKALEFIEILEQIIQTY